MRNILIKGSGDITDSQQFFDFVVQKAQSNYYVVIIYGGGTKISAALKKAGYAVEFDQLGRRITKTWEEMMVIWDILEHEEKRLRDKFVEKNIVILQPILYAGSVLCPINGDDLVKAYYLGRFNEICVLTKKERVEKKRVIFEEYPKVKVIGI